jgi:hypothetical protein
MLWESERNYICTKHVLRDRKSLPRTPNPTTDGPPEPGAQGQQKNQAPRSRRSGSLLHALSGPVFRGSTESARRKGANGEGKVVSLIGGRRRRPPTPFNAPSFRTIPGTYPGQHFRLVFFTFALMRLSHTRGRNRYPN